MSIIAYIKIDSFVIFNFAMRRIPYLAKFCMFAKSATVFGNLKTSYNARCGYALKNNQPLWPDYMCIQQKNLDRNIARDMLVIENFLTVDEESNLFEEVEPYMKRLQYEFDHWDDAIHGYRETERLKWNEENTKIIQRVRNTAFSDEKQLSLVHVLDLAENGVIKPHIDSLRFCGDTIAGLSLLSNCVMRLARQNEPNNYVDVLLRRRSLYVMKGVARYDYTHEILGNDCSSFKGSAVVKSRRLSIICRNEPVK